MLAIPCTTRCVFYLCEREMCVGHTMHHKVYFTYVKEMCVCWLHHVPRGVFYLCEGEVCVGHTMHHKMCFTCVKERCVLAILCTTRCVLPV